MIHNPFKPTTHNPFKPMQLPKQHHQPTKQHHRPTKTEIKPETNLRLTTHSNPQPIQTQASKLVQRTATNFGDQKPQPTTSKPQRAKATVDNNKPRQAKGRLQTLPSPSSPSRSTTATIAFKHCHRHHRLQALLLSLSSLSSVIAFKLRHRVR